MTSKSRKHTHKKKNGGESERMKSLNEAKKKIAETKVLKKTNRGPENKNRDSS